jgi:hypothetical protein
VKDAVGVDGDDDFGGGMHEGVAYGARFAAVEFIAAGADGDVGEVALRL